MKKPSRRAGRILCILFLLAGSAAYLYHYAQNWVERRHLYLMDTLIEVVFYGPHGGKAADVLETRLKEWEENTSLYRPDGDIGRLNAGAGEGQPVSLHPEVFELLAQAKELSLKSEGLFDPTIAPLTLLWNVGGEDAHLPDRQAIESARALVDVKDLVLNAQDSSARLSRPGQAVDLGGIAKGAASRIVFSVMEEYGVKNGYVSLGGNLVVRGRHPQGRDFLFGVRDPWGEESDCFASISLSGQTMATAGDYIRYFEEDGKRYAHIIDPRTGYPAESDLSSVSVISSDGAFADLLSTTLFIAGKQAVFSQLEGTEYLIIAVDREKNVYASAALQGRLQPNPEQPEFVFHFG